jgi:putative flippase GtrA
MSTRVRFLAAGILNFLVSNICLQILLLIPTIPTVISASISQGINAVLGFFLYRTTVFSQQRAVIVQQPSKTKAREGLRYSILSIGLLTANTIGINLANIGGLSRNLGAILMIPLLTVISYCGQKYWVFRHLVFTNRE